MIGAMNLFATEGCAQQWLVLVLFNTYDSSPVSDTVSFNPKRLLGIAAE